ncbi:HPr family phosphocarrier protein [Geosporobacter ferrireducens]|uniref:Phosphocarrier protein HPr n=1 Tax=Geosporobacter ferrireducens TaxID=1424294 RepID=A0A1D8GHI6_9FIRM|nr:HPr family phosphocarrier protein [Geosporobacter ferrireducens]AOT70354.1 phosphocarrier protein HPr [Geosporobacter ferrireducens]MTI54327.1 HPr family phosphocarrier protein [Geosporobacter ferrireducens]
MYKAEVIISNKSGLHARPASLFVKEAGKYDSIIKVIKNGKEYDSKSIIGILSMGAVEGDRITISAEGPDEKEAVEGLVRLLESKFGEA